MSMTMTQKILAAHAGLQEVRAGQLIKAKLDLVLGNDITTPVAINEFEAAGFNQVFDKSRIAMVMDHFAPNKDIKSATQCKQCRTFARRFDIDNYFDVGTMGIEHALLPEKGLVGPGDAVIGALLLERGDIGISGLEWKVEILDAEIVHIETLQKSKRVIGRKPVARISGHAKLEVDLPALGAGTVFRNGLAPCRRKRERGCCKEITTCNH